MSTSLLLRSIFNPLKHLTSASKEISKISSSKFLSTNSSNLLINNTDTECSCNNSLFRRNYGIFSSSTNEGFIKGLQRKIGLNVTDTSKTVLNASGYLLFLSTADGVNYAPFFELCKMEDTFTSWFIVVELHVWLLSCRLMEEGDDGLYVRNVLIKTMWSDVDKRSRKLEGAVSSARRTQVKELGQQFKTQLFLYDQGILGTDTALANALWFRFLNKNEAPRTDDEFWCQVKAVELLVAYVRYHHAYLNKLTKRELLLKRIISWKPLSSSLLNT